LAFEKNAFFRQKLAKIAKKCDHNIDPKLRVGQLNPVKV
jgi:hypothetical protein